MSTWANAAAATRAANGWPPCSAGCGWPLDPAAAAGGHDRHPNCQTKPTTRGEKR